MSNFEKLTELCLKQGRGIYTSSTHNHTSIAITEPNSLDIDREMGGRDSINYFASLLLDNMKKEIVARLRVVK